MNADDSGFVKEDTRRYFMLTKPQRVTKAMHSLEGLLKGIAIDGDITLEEIWTLRQWLIDNHDILQHDPFAELQRLIDETMADGHINPQEKEDILWFCRQFTTENNYFSTIVSDMQRLHGILGGIIADNVISREELDGLQAWLNQHEELRSYWPFDEIDLLVKNVLADGKIDEVEQQTLLDFFGEFFNFSTTPSQPNQRQRRRSVSAICAVDPDIQFENRSFCFSGSSTHAPREKIRSLVSERGGRIEDSLEEPVDYLVIGAAGNPCWSFTCYGRKVETAMRWRRQGTDVQIIREADFWKAVEHQ